MDRLLSLYQDKATLEDFKALFLNVLQEETLKRAFARKDIGGIADAKELMDKVFERLDEMFEPQKKRKQPSSK